MSVKEIKEILPTSDIDLYIDNLSSEFLINVPNGLSYYLKLK